MAMQHGNRVAQIQFKPILSGEIIVEVVRNDKNQLGKQRPLHGLEPGTRSTNLSGTLYQSMD